MRSRHWLAVLLASTAFSRVVRSEDLNPPGPSAPGAASGSTSPSPAEPSKDNALSVQMEPGAAGFDADALREAIAKEASVLVTSGEATDGPRLFVRGRGARELMFEFVDASGRRVTRTIELPEDTTARQLGTAALVAVGLLEDEAGELLAHLRAEAQKAAPPPPAPPPAPPPKPAAPAEKPRLTPALPPCARPTPRHVRWLGADLAPYVGTSSSEPEGTVRRVSIQFLGGHTAGVDGVSFSPILDLAGDFVCGVQVAGLAGWVSGPVEGVAVSGALQRTGDVRGVSIGGLGTLAGDVRGVELGGAFAWAEHVSGVQASGLLSMSESVHGVQLAAVSSTVDVRGLQLGALNVAGDVKGLQLGVVNIARRSEASVGVVSFITGGRTTVHGFVDTKGLTTLALQHGSRLVHNFYGGVVSPLSREGLGFGPMIGIGLHALESRRFFLDVDALANVLFSTTGATRPQALYQARVVGGFRLSPSFAVYAGPTYDVLMVPTGQAPRVGEDIALGMQESATGGGRLHLSYGGVLGVRGL